MTIKSGDEFKAVFVSPHWSPSEVQMISEMDVKKTLMEFKLDNSFVSDMLQNFNK